MGGAAHLSARRTPDPQTAARPSVRAILEFQAQGLMSVHQVHGLVDASDTPSIASFGGLPKLAADILDRFNDGCRKPDLTVLRKSRPTDTSEAQDSLNIVRLSVPNHQALMRLSPRL